MKMNVLCAILALVFVFCLAVTLVGCNLIESEEVVEVTAVVVEKDYRASYTTYYPMKVGKVTTMMPQVHPEKHYVTVQYEDMTEIFEDEDLYDRVEKGEQVEIYLYRGYDKDGVLVRKELRLEK